MKTQRTFSAKRGFTLMELMVAMAVTTIIITVLVSITSVALDTWNRSRAELRASRQGKSMVDSMARDFESLVTRRGNTYEWLSAITSSTPPGKNLKSTNACDLIFLTAATDRYDGQVGTATDKGGDVSCTSYALKYTDPIEGTSGRFDTFVLNRLLVNPDDTFNDLLGKTDLSTAFGSYSSKLSKPENFVCENIYQFSLTFHVQVARISGAGASATTTLVDVPITVGQKASGQVAKEFHVSGSGITAEVSSGSATTAELKAGRLTAVEISLTVVSDFGIDQLRARPDLSAPGAKQSEFLMKNAYQYTKLVQVPSM